MKKILFVWDFHGVLEKGNDRAVQEICNKLLSELGSARKITIEEVRSLYGARWFDYFSYLIPNSPCEVDWCVKGAIKIGTDTAVQYIQANDHAKNVLMSLKEAGHCNIVISTSTPESIRWFVGAIGLEKYIDYCMGIDPSREYHQGGNFDRVEEKAKGIQGYIQQASCPFDRVVVVGDTEEDIKAGHLCGATTYRFVPHEDLSFPTTCADYVIYDLREVLKEIRIC